MKQAATIFNLIIAVAGIFATVIFSSLGIYVNLEKKITKQGEAIKNNTEKVQDLEQQIEQFENIGLEILLEVKDLKKDNEIKFQKLDKIEKHLEQQEKNIDKFYQLNKNLLRP